MTKTFYSNGKLLLTGEYAILDGAKGLALPTKFGQYLSITTNISNIISWKSYDEQKVLWFEAEFSIDNLKTVNTCNTDISDRLSKILAETYLLNPAFLSASTGYSVETALTFNKAWGLGSSSTLIANISSWAEGINPYQLLAATFGGSGYDIACATHNKPILYESNAFKPIVTEVSFNPEFSDKLYFIYLNQKKNSREAIAAYRNLSINKNDLISNINKITNAIWHCNQLQKFESLLVEHEQLLSKVLKIPTIKESLFSDYPNTIKSLGAWGGDFILATGSSKDMGYFRAKGYTTILPFSKMIL